MPYKAVCAVCLLAIVGISFSYSETVYAWDTTTVCQWKGDKDGAVSITFDDTTIGQYTKAFPALKERGLAATYFTIVNYIGWTGNKINADQLRDLADNGQEIGSHTVSHWALTQISHSQMVYELEQSQIILEQITGKPVDTIAYPNGLYNDDVAYTTSLYYIAGRGATVASLNSASPGWYWEYRLRCVPPHYYGGGDANAIAGLEYWAHQADVQHKWAVEMFHSIGNPTIYDDVSTTAFTTHLDYLKANESCLWVAPMGTVMKYIYERDAAHIYTNTDVNSITVDVNCYLDSRFNVPLTLITPCPDNWLTKPLAACQGQTILSASHYTKFGHDYIMYDAVPDAGTIILYPVEPNAPPLLVTGNFDNNYAVDARDIFIFSQAWLKNSQDPDWQLFAQCDLDLNGTIDFADFALFATRWTLFSPEAPPLAVSGNAGMDGVTMNGLPGYPVTTYGGFYSAAVPAGWSGTVTPVKTGVSFVPSSKSFSNVIIDEPNQNFTAASIIPAISGNAGMDGVTMDGLPGNPVTSGGGLYSAVVPYGWNGTVTPAKLGYRFSPASVAYADVTANLSNRNFTATQAFNCTISGSAGVNGVVMTGLPGNPVTSGGGFYSAVVPYGWSGTITPTKTNYNFSPASVSYTNVTSDMPNRNFVATQLVTDCNISGSVGVDGVTMTGLPGDPCSSGGGLYSAIVPYGWSGTITPTKAGYIFNPASISYTNVGSDLSDRNFTATQVTSCTISGTTGVDDVNMDGLPGNPFTSGGGLFSAVVPYGWSGTITPTKANYSFNPASVSYTNVTSDMPNRNFVATQLKTNCAISGSVGVDGVTMNGFPGDPVAGADGSYSVVVPYGWTGTVTPTKAGFDFTPASISYTDVNSDQMGQDYVVAAITFTISGTVGTDGVTMTGLPGDPVASADGSYSVVVPYGWTGTVTPTKAGFDFTPPNMSYVDVIADQSNQDYQAASN